MSPNLLMTHWPAASIPPLRPSWPRPCRLCSSSSRTAAHRAPLPPLRLGARQRLPTAICRRLPGPSGPASLAVPGSWRSQGLPAILTMRSEEHTSELQSLRHLVCRLLLEKKKLIYIFQESKEDTKTDSNDDARDKGTINLTIDESFQTVLEALLQALAWLDPQADRLLHLI